MRPIHEGVDLSVEEEGEVARVVHGHATRYLRGPSTGLHAENGQLQPLSPPGAAPDIQRPFEER
jgi:hypothetical protein